MASLQSATYIIGQLQNVVDNSTENPETSRREALRLSQLLTSALEKPEDLAFETSLLVRYPNHVFMGSGKRTDS